MGLKAERCENPFVSYLQAYNNVLKLCRENKAEYICTGLNFFSYCILFGIQ